MQRSPHHHHHHHRRKRRSSKAASITISADDVVGLGMFPPLDFNQGPRIGRIHRAVTMRNLAFSNAANMDLDHFSFTQCNALTASYSPALYDDTTLALARTEAVLSRLQAEMQHREACAADSELVRNEQLRWVDREHEERKMQNMQWREDARALDVEKGKRNKQKCLEQSHQLALARKQQVKREKDERSKALWSSFRMDDSNTNNTNNKEYDSKDSYGVHAPRAVVSVAGCAKTFSIRLKDAEETIPTARKNRRKKKKLPQPLAAVKTKMFNPSIPFGNENSDEEIGLF